MTHPFSLSGKTVLVTGATAGLGRQTAITAAQMGARVIVTGRNEERLAATHTQLEGPAHLAIAANLVDEKEREALVSQLPALDGLVSKWIPAQRESRSRSSNAASSRELTKAASTVP